MSKVYVAVNLDSGWDNVVGVFDSYDKAKAACLPVGDQWDDDQYTSLINNHSGIYEMYHIHEKEVQ